MFSASNMNSSTPVSASSSSSLQAEDLMDLINPAGSLGLARYRSAPVFRDGGLSEPTLAHRPAPTYEEPTVYRSISMAPPAMDHHSFGFANNNNSAAKGWSQFDANFSSFGIHDKASFAPSSGMDTFGPKKHTITTATSFLPTATFSVNTVKPPSCPMFLEPSHFYSSSSPEVIVQQIELACDKADVQIEMQSPFSFCCYGVARSETIKFYISVFTDDKSEDTRYIIEFQRRSGDCMSFGQVLHNVHSNLESILTHFQPLPAFGSSMTTSLPSTDVSEQHTLQAIECLIEMSTSEFDDVQSEALRAISEMTLKASNCNVIASHQKTIDRLLICMSSASEEVHRCATVALSNILAAGKVEVSQFLFKNDFAIKLRHLINNSKTSTVIRESARALLQLSKSLNDACKQSEDVRLLAQQLQCHHDRKVREIGLQLRDQLVLA